MERLESIKIPPWAPPRLVFTDVSFKVFSRAGWRGKQQEAQLLKGVSGVLEPARMTAITGPSGSGKTTLLDVLAGQHFGGKVDGSVTVNGMSVDAWCGKHGTASYVMQHDVLPVLDTPREALTTAALLRLPTSVPREDKMERVKELLEVLDLEACADLMIGDSTLGARGLSGGQRRRVTIGIELIKNPNLIFLDEPLSGLDSEMGEQVVQSLTRLARQGRTIMLSIHGASGTVMGAFDSVILLAGGRLVFQGSCDAAQSFLESLGHTRLLDQTRPEFWVSVLKDTAAAGAAADAFAAGRLSPATSTQLKKEDSSGSLPAEGTDAAQPDPEERKQLTYLLSSARAPLIEAGLNGHGRTPVWQQAWVLLRRNMRWRLRNRKDTGSLIAMAVFAGLLMGIIFFKASDELVLGVYDRTAIFFFIAAIANSQCNNIAIMAWMSMRTLVRREYQTGLYGTLAFYLAHVVECSWVILILSVLLSVQYGLQGLQAVATKYLLWVVIVFLTSACGYLLGIIIALLAASGPTAVALQAAINALLIAGSNFLSRNPPVFLRWIQEASFMTYSYTAMVLNECDGLTLQGRVREVTLQGAPPFTGAMHADWGLGGALGMLAGITLAFLLAAYITLLPMARIGRL